MIGTPHPAFKLGVIAALTVACWIPVGLVVLAFVKWPAPMATHTAAAAAAAFVAYRWTKGRSLDVDRADAAKETFAEFGFEGAFDNQRLEYDNAALKALVSGETPAVGDRCHWCNCVATTTAELTVDQWRKRTVPACRICIDLVRIGEVAGG
jgi:hypothetical protein